MRDAVLEGILVLFWRFQSVIPDSAIASTYLYATPRVLGLTIYFKPLCGLHGVIERYCAGEWIE